MTGGIGGEIVALISENCFQYLDAPVKRVASMDTPVPFVTQLEQQFLPKNRLDEVIDEIMKF
jgi:2-oxoisovalerate dehydrogenase E1 component